MCGELYEEFHKMEQEAICESPWRAGNQFKFSKQLTERFRECYMEQGAGLDHFPWHTRLTGTMCLSAYAPQIQPLNPISFHHLQKDIISQYFFQCMLPSSFLYQTQVCSSISSSSSDWYKQGESCFGQAAALSCSLRFLSLPHNGGHKDYYFLMLMNLGIN